jgi:hypothetical protein
MGFWFGCGMLVLLRAWREEAAQAVRSSDVKGRILAQGRLRSSRAPQRMGVPTAGHWQVRTMGTRSASLGRKGAVCARGRSRSKLAAFHDGVWQGQSMMRRCEVHGRSCTRPGQAL